MDNDKLVPLILVKYFCKMLGNITNKLDFSKSLLRTKGNKQVMAKINIETNEAIYHKCDIGYIHLRKGMENGI